MQMLWTEMSQSGTGITKKLSPDAVTSSRNERHHLSGEKQNFKPYKVSRNIIYPILADMYPFLQI